MLKDSGNSNIQTNRVRPTNPFTRFKKEDIEQSIPARFEQMVEMFPDRLAVKTQDQELTYRELNQAANRVAHAILAHRGNCEEIIAGFFQQGVSWIVAFLGVLKSGKIYVPLDPNHPRVRLEHVLKDTEASIVLTDTTILPLVNDLVKTDHLSLNIDDIDLNISKENPGLLLTADALSCLIYTSGSSGEPKGVMQNHRNFLHTIMNRTNEFQISSDDRSALFFPPSFIDGVRIVLQVLLNGASVFPYDVKANGITNLSDWVMNEEITIYPSAPSLFRQFADSLTQKIECPNLRLICLGTEPAIDKDFELYKKLFPDHCLLNNGIGSTETGGYCSFFMNKESHIDGSLVPVGYPTEGCEVFLIDETGEEVGVEQFGEIAIKSQFLSPGYWRRPDLTRKTFLSNPEGGCKRIYQTGDLGRKLPDGCLIHLGRKDFQVKVRGYRVEVAEIESALYSIESVKEAVVHPKKDELGDQHLAAYIVPANDSTPNVSDIRRILEKKLPDYMIPSAFVMLDELPLTSTGKVDRKALPDPSGDRPELDAPFLAPRTFTEEKVSEIWAEVLGLKQVGIHDPFLDLGGDSLRAMQVISRVIDKFHVEIPITVLFEAPTVAEMSAIIAQHLTPEDDPDS